jgi:hypothetical protein
MKVSELKNYLAEFLVQNEDCEVKLFCESVVYDDVFDQGACEVITDLRAVSDWPLPGESLVTDGENPGKLLVMFYDNPDSPRRSHRFSLIG